MNSRVVSLAAVCCAASVLPSWGGRCIYEGSFWTPDGFYGDGRIASSEFLRHPDQAPHGHVLSYSVEVPRTGWYALFFKGGAPKQDYFVDDRLAASFRAASPDEGGQSFSLYLERGTRVLRIERTGRRSFPQYKFDRFRLCELEATPANWFFAEKSGHDVVRMGEPVRFAVTAGLPDRPVEYEFKAAVKGEPLQWIPLARVAFPATPEPATRTVELRLPKEGMYAVKAFADGRELPQCAFPEFTVVAVDVARNEFGAPDGRTETVVDIDCAAKTPDAEANGASKVVHRDGMAYRESHDCSQNADGPFDGNDPEHLSCFAYDVRLPEAQVPYLLEVEYPDNERRSVCVRHDWLREGTREYLRENSGYQAKSFETGGFFPLTGGLCRQRQIIWPLSREGVVTIINQSAGTRAAVGRIRLLRFPGDRVPTPGPSRRDGRLFAYWSEEGDSFMGMLGARVGKGPDGREFTYLDAAKRWFQMVRFYGGNAVSGCGFAYQGVYWHSRAFAEADMFDFSALRLFALLGEKYGVKFIPEWFNVQWYKDLVVYPKVAGGREHSQAMNASGGISGGGVNVLCPAVQDSLVAAMREIHDEIGDSPAFGGLTVRADQWQFRGEFFYKSLNWGYNESVVREFEREAGLTVPAETATGRYQFLTSPDVRDRWIAWRCGKIGDFHQRILAALRGPARKDVFFGIGGQFDQENLYRREDTLAERALGSGVDMARCRDSDGFAIIPAARYGARTPSVADRRNYDGFFREDSVSDGLGAPRAFASYMQYMELGTEWPAARLGFDLKAQGGHPPYHCSATIAAGRAGLEKYAVVLADQDSAYLREGGNCDSFVSPEILGPWLVEYERLPAVKFDRVPGKNDPVAVWQQTIGGKLWYYAVNRESFPASVRLEFSHGEAAEVQLEPYGLKVFEDAAGRTVAKAESDCPEEYKTRVRNLLATAQARAKIVRSPEYDALLSRAWRAAEAGKWWRVRAILNRAEMFEGYAQSGALPEAVLRAQFPDKLDLQSPRNGHWELCTPSTPAAMLKVENRAECELVDSRAVNGAWGGDKVVWSKQGVVALRIEVPADGDYDLTMGVVCAEAGVASVAVNGKLLPRACEFGAPRRPTTAVFRRIPLKAGSAVVKLSASSAAGVYGLRFLPVLRPVPGEDWIVAGPFPRNAFAAESSGDKGLGQGLDELARMDLGALEWQWATPGVRDALSDRGVHMPLRIGSTGNDRFIARTTIVSDRDRSATLVVAVDWWCRAVLNGKPVRTDVVGGGSEVNGASFWGFHPLYTGIVQLRKGENDLVLYGNGGTLGSAIAGWITDSDEILTSAVPPRGGIRLSNGQVYAEVDATHGGRVMAFGQANGRNLFWRNESARRQPNAEGWHNLGGEKTWVGTISDWRGQFGVEQAWPPPRWFDASPFAVTHREGDRVDLRSRLSPGDRWNVVLRRQLFLEDASLVVRSSLETVGWTAERPERMWNWSVTQIPDAKRLAVHLTGRKRTTWGVKESDVIPAVERRGDWIFYDFKSFGDSRLMNYDADVIAAEFDDGWLVFRQRVDAAFVEPFAKPRCAVFRSGEQAAADPGISKRYIEMEFLSYGPRASMDVVVTFVKDLATTP